MYKVRKTSKNGDIREMLVNTETYHRILNAPGVFLPEKYEIIREKAPKPVATIVTSEPEIEKNELEKTEIIDELVRKFDDYGEAEYKADAALAKKEPTIETIERMLAYKPTPYWKGKLNKLING